MGSAPSAVAEDTLRPASSTSQSIAIVHADLVKHLRYSLRLWCECYTGVNVVCLQNVTLTVFTYLLDLASGTTGSGSGSDETLAGSYSCHVDCRSGVTAAVAALACFMVCTGWYAGSAGSLPR